MWNTIFCSHTRTDCSNTMRPAARSASASQRNLLTSTLMLSLKDRFKLLEADLLAEPPAFVMSRQLPFAIFRYDPNHPEEREWRVRKQSDLLATRAANHLHKP